MGDEEGIVHASARMTAKSFIRRWLRDNSAEGHDVLLQLALDSDNRVTALFRPGILVENVLMVVDNA